MRIKLLILISIVALVIPLYGQNGEYKVIAENNKFIMLFNEKTAEVAIKIRLQEKYLTNSQRLGRRFFNGYNKIHYSFPLSS